MKPKTPMKTQLTQQIKEILEEIEDQAGCAVKCIHGNDPNGAILCLDGIVGIVQVALDSLHDNSEA
jgi:hypothetical protein